MPCDTKPLTAKTNATEEDTDSKKEVVLNLQSKTIHETPYTMHSTRLDSNSSTGHAVLVPGYRDQLANKEC